MPTTEGGRIVVMARHLVELFEQHEKGDNLPFIEYFNNLQKVTQKHIQRVVKLAAVEAYQESTSDAEKIREIVMNDMADQLIIQLKDDPEAQAEVERKDSRRLYGLRPQELTFQYYLTARLFESAAKKFKHKRTRKLRRSRTALLRKR
ncbi:hypothetical protein BJY52DRAFT_1225809 [Lactarius psammicola]|nr:hypothetical protein BJY52DRAFT_1225809 [Lactarius psammicola]